MYESRAYEQIVGPMVPPGPAAPPPITLTPSGPVAITTNGQIVEELEIVAGAGQHGITVAAGITDWTIRKCMIWHPTNLRGISGNGGNHRGTIQQVSIEHLDYNALPQHGGFTAYDANNNIYFPNSDDLLLDRVRLRGGSSGVFFSICNRPIMQFIEGYNFRGVFPRGQLVQWVQCNDPILQDFSVICDPNDDRPEDLFNAFQTNRAIVRRGLTQGGASPSGTGGLFEGSCTDCLMEDVDTIDPHNVGFGFHAGAVSQTHPAIPGFIGNIARRCRIAMGRSLDCRWFNPNGFGPGIGTCYPKSANISPPDATGLPTTSGLIVSVQVGTTIFEECAFSYDPSTNVHPTLGPLPLNLIFPAANAQYVTSQAVDLAEVSSFVPRQPIQLVMPWE